MPISWSHPVIFMCIVSQLDIFRLYCFEVVVVCVCVNRITYSIYSASSNHIKALRRCVNACPLLLIYIIYNLMFICLLLFRWFHYDEFISESWRLRRDVIGSWGHAQLMNGQLRRSHWSLYNAHSVLTSPFQFIDSVLISKTLKLW